MLGSVSVDVMAAVQRLLLEAARRGQRADATDDEKALRCILDGGEWRSVEGVYRCCGIHDPSAGGASPANECECPPAPAAPRDWCNRRVIYAVSDYEPDDNPDILLTKTGSDPVVDSCLSTDYIRMICNAGKQQGFEVASRLRDAAVSILMEVVREEVVVQEEEVCDIQGRTLDCDGIPRYTKFVHSISIGEDRTEQDTTTLRPMIDIELTVLSDIRRFPAQQ